MKGTKVELEHRSAGEIVGNGQPHLSHIGVAITDPYLGLKGVMEYTGYLWAFVQEQEGR